LLLLEWLGIWLVIWWLVWAELLLLRWCRGKGVVLLVYWLVILGFGKCSCVLA
jgi:hypothetical protein